MKRHQILSIRLLRKVLLKQINKSPLATSINDVRLRARLTKGYKTMKSLISQKAQAEPLIGPFLMLTGAFVSVAMSVQLPNALHFQIAAVGALFIMAGMAMLKLSGGVRVAAQAIKANAIPFAVTLLVLCLLAINLASWSPALLQLIL